MKVKLLIRLCEHRLKCFCEHRLKCFCTPARLPLGWRLVGDSDLLVDYVATFLLYSRRGRVVRDDGAIPPAEPSYGARAGDRRAEGIISPPQGRLSATAPKPVATPELFDLLSLHEVSHPVTQVKHEVKSPTLNLAMSIYFCV